MATAVFVHGNPEVAALWDPLVAALGERGQADVIRLSPPGFGAPTPAGWEPTVEAYRNWLIAELEGLHASGHGPIDLVGHDWGAGHVFGAVGTRPDLVRSWAADCFGLIHPDYVWHDMAQAWQTPEVGEQLIGSMVETPLADRIALFEGFGAPPQIAAAMAAGLDQEMGRCILGLYRAAIQPASANVGRLLQAAARPPGLAIVAGEDPYVSADLSRDMASALGVATLELAGAGHWWMFEPQLAADGLVGFWSTLA
jgi:pimeloyl-ACP methyl ester carboxylesterase